MKWLATWIMKSFVNDSQSEWTLAMQSEFQELTSGHLSWALGCAFIRFRSSFWSHVELLLAITTVHFVAPVFAAFVSVPFFRHGGFALSQIVAFCYAAPWAFLLGMYRPKNLLAIAVIGGLILPTASGYTVAAAIRNMELLEYIKGIGSTMLVGLNGVGTIAMVLLWYGSATLGSRVVRRRELQN